MNRNKEGLSPLGKEDAPVPDAEVGQQAYQYIQDFKHGISNIPQFALVLQERYLSEMGREPYQRYGVDKTIDPVRDPIHFVKGEYQYGIQYNSLADKEWLVVEKTLAADTEILPSGSFLEKIVLEADLNEKSHQFDKGIIRHAIHRTDGTKEYCTGTRLAVQRVEGFLKRNFSEPQPHPVTGIPPYK
jgi:hypothetical protein